MAVENSMSVLPGEGVISFYSDHPLIAFIVTVIIGYGIFHLFQQWRKERWISKNRQFVEDYSHEMYQRMCSDPNFAVNFDHYYQEWEHWVQDNQLQNYPFIWPLRADDIIMAYIHDATIPPEGFIRGIFNVEVNMRPDEHPIFVWAANLSRNSFSENATGGEELIGNCLVTVTDQGMYMTTHTHIEYIKRGNFGILSSDGYHVQVQRRQPPSYHFNLRPIRKSWNRAAMIVPALKTRWQYLSFIDPASGVVRVVNYNPPYSNQYQEDDYSDQEDD